MGIPRITIAEASILAALSSADELYGLAIIHEIKNLGGSVSLGGLYTLLHRLEKKSLVDGRWGDESEAREGARRRYYRITATGSRALANLQRAVGVPKRRLAFEGGSR